MFNENLMQFSCERHVESWPSGEARGDYAARSVADGVRPIAFGNCRGILHWASGKTGIVMCSPWGYEELVVRHGWRVLAEKFAAAGFPCLRFDYPGTADSIGDLTEFSFRDWVDATKSACDVMRANGVQKLILVGQSVGCLVACKTAEQVETAGLVLLSPTSGRRYLRELAAWSFMLAQVEGHSVTSEEGAIAIAGFSLPAAFANDIKSFALAQRPAAWALLVEPTGRADKAFADRLTALGTTVEHLAYDGFDSLVGDPTTSQVPRKTYDAVLAVVLRRCPSEPRTMVRPDRPIDCDPLLLAPAYSEEAIYFGKQTSLFGILCTPRTETPAAAAVLFLNTGRNAHIGWGRMTVDHARRLAAKGIASFRIDIAGVGESPPRDERQEEFLYTDLPVPDVMAAIDVLVARGARRIALAGVCSGAYLALLGTLADQRVTSLVAINLPRFAWGKNESISAAIRFSNRPNAQSLKRVLNLDTLRLIMTGKLDLRAALIFRLNSQLRRIGLRMAPFIGPLSPSWPIYRQARQRLAALQARGIKVLLGYTADDEGVDELALLFGAEGKRLNKYPGVRLSFVGASDHNLSQAHARDWLCAGLLETVQQDLKKNG